MPSKSHRAASRQAQLREKRRRGKTRAQAFDPGPADGVTSSSVDAAAVDEGARPRPSAAAPLSGSQRPYQPARRARQRPAGVAPPPHSYMGRELRQIALTMTVILVILGVLTFVLRG